ncbi:metallophosphoesterase [Aquibacillus saliphilus]|uniref:metallophosphoesterase n=1 Tax=Aquibacillus saliphilus TaxID=1909422 RepID=UPI001CEFFD14|nr:metallophosphoesterase [Aquibacillus saliphilus]
MNKKRLAFFAFLVLLLISLAKVYFDTNYFKVNEVEFNSNKIQEGSEITIMQISDLHNKTFVNNNEKLISTVKELDANIIVLTGDMIDRKTEELEDTFDLIETITSINKHVYFVSGNHEWENAQTEAFFNGLRDRGVTILDNKNTQITEESVTLNLVGVADSSTNHEDINKAFANINDDWYTVLLSHSPDIIKKYNNESADLVLCGHTHGGQVRFPVIGALVAPGQGIFPELEKGIYQIEQNRYLYIDSGLGTSVLPIRFLNQSQLSLITITKS